MPRSREHEKRPAAGREKMINVKKKTHSYIVTYIYKVPLRGMSRGVAQERIENIRHALCIVRI